MDPFETFKHAGLTVELHYDEDGSWANPRDNDGNVVTMLNLSRDYADLDDAPALRGAIARWGFDDERKIRTYLQAFHDVIYCDRWSWQGSSQSDWGHGWGYITRQAMRDAGWTDDKITPEFAERVFKAEVGTFESWAAGEVFGYVIKDPETGYDLESCWGFIGDDRYDDAGNRSRDGMSYVEREAREMAEHLAPIVAHDKLLAAQGAHADYCRKVIKVAQLLTDYRGGIWTDIWEDYQQDLCRLAEAAMTALGIAPVERPDTD